MPEPIDILEDKLYQQEPKLLKTLLIDRTTQKNIFWATDSYTDNGEGYQRHDQLTEEAITGVHGKIIMPRALKKKDEQLRRSRKMAEVFTPSWIVKMMNETIYKDWIEKENRPLKEVWQRYVMATHLELTCGEAPFLTSRYDAVTGEVIPLNERFGVLDHKLQVINDYCLDEEWTRWSLLALGSVYGYEWQGDSLLLAREALLATLCEFHEQRFGAKADVKNMLMAAEIISWNVWQMDGLKGVVPASCHDQKITTLDMFGQGTTTTLHCAGCENENILQHNGIRCQLRRWVPSDEEMPEHFECEYTEFITKQFKQLKKKKWPMKFDYVIGNPPYQETTLGTSDKPLYHFFMDGAYQISPKVLLITPGRFLFNAGKTPRAWNIKMLSDDHLKVLEFYPNSDKVFVNKDIKGGIAITLHDITKDFGAIRTFTNFPLLNSIFRKISPSVKETSLKDIFYVQNKFLLNVLYRDYPHYKQIIGSNGKERRLTTSILGQLDLFKETKENDQYIEIVGLQQGQRVTKFIDKKYIDSNRTNLPKWKVLVPKSNGSGALGEVLSTPMIGEPMIGYTQTFLGIGAFDHQEEAQATFKYIKSKFARTLLGILKVTQDNPPDTWKYVPLQDFSSSSDIDWSKSVHEIDVQLYDKYGLTAEECNFIETHVKEME